MFLGIEFQRCGSIWLQLSQTLFISTGLFGDLLVIRLFLFVGNLFSLIHILQGSPRFLDDTNVEGQILVPPDSLCWALLNMYLQGTALMGLLLDELPVPLKEEERALWRYFYRRSGISKVVFERYLLPKMEFEEYEEGEVIQEPHPMKPKVHIVLDGIVQCSIAVKGQLTQILLKSGDVFDLKYFNVFGIHVGFFEQELRAVAGTKVKLFSFDVDDLERMGQGSQFVRQAWNAIITAAISGAAERNYDPIYTQLAGMSPKERRNMEGVRDHLFGPLETFEAPPFFSPGSGQFFKHPYISLLKTMAASFSPPYPFSPISHGVRHVLTIPPTGKAAYQRVRGKALL